MGDENPIRTLRDYSKPSHKDYTTQMSIDYIAGGRLRKLRPDKAWATIERLAQYEDEGWNDTFIPDEMSLNYENLDIEQLLGIMECKPSHQEEFEHIGINFILDQEERVKQLEEYMKVIIGNFMQLSSEVTRGLKEKIGGEQREMSLLEFGWRISLYIEQHSRDRATLSGLSRAETVKANLMLLEFWPNIGDKGFNVGNTKVKSIRDPESVGDKNLIYGRMLITRIARLFKVLTGEMMNALSVEPPPYVFKKKSLIAMGVIMELHDGGCCWPATREVMVKVEDKGDDEGDEAAGEYVGHEGVGGSADIYHNMSQGDWQVSQAR
ncbi:hypothetical protein Tco_0917728 [Tanacetum coccineum]